MEESRPTLPPPIPTPTKPPAKPPTPKPLQGEVRVYSMWNEARNPTIVRDANGRLYYWHSETRVSQWDKPLELCSDDEREAIEAAERSKREFFSSMEANIRRKLQKGFHSSAQALEVGEGDEVGEDEGSSSADAEVGSNAGASNCVNAREAVPEGLMPLTNVNRTISRLEDEVVAELANKDKDLNCISPLQRRNSEASNIALGTVTHPDVHIQIKVVCAVYRAHILEDKEGQPEGEGEGERDGCDFELFNDPGTTAWGEQGITLAFASLSHPSTIYSAVSVPALDAITFFFTTFYERCRLNVDCIVLPLIYIERMLKVTAGKLRPRATNWKSLLTSALCLSSKVWDDDSMWNSDFSALCPSFTTARLNQLELSFLEVLKYDVTVDRGEYTRYHFLLRKMSMRSGLLSTVPTEARGSEGGQRVAALSAQFRSAQGLAFPGILASRSITEGAFTPQHSNGTLADEIVEV